MSSSNDPFNSPEVNDLESSIEQAIDDLFVPIEGSDDSFALADMDGPPKDNIDKLSHPELMNPASEEAPPLREEESPHLESQDLLEPLNECLLSLDWEINLENIKALQAETHRLTEVLKNDRHSMIIIKMIMMVLKYLLTMKEDSSPVSINLLHTAVKCLELFHKPHDKTEDEVSGLLIDLKNEFRSIKNEIIAPSESEENATQIGFDENEDDETFCVVSPSVMTKDMQDLIMQMSEIFSIMQKGVARLSFLDKLFDKNPSLAETQEYFNEVKKDFLNKINDAIAIETSLLKIVKNLNKRMIEADESIALSEEIKSVDGPPPLPEADEPLPNEEMASPAPEAGGDMPEQTILPAICVANIENHKIGIPESFVANVFEVSPKKVQKFNDRGYVTLLDFSRRFRSIKKGLGPNLNGLSAKVLKTIKFPIIKLNRKASEYDDMNEPSEPVIKGIILLSNGLQHAALFTDEIMDKQPLEISHYDETSSFNEVSGTATVGEDETAVNVIDVEYILSYIV